MTKTPKLPQQGGSYIRDKKGALKQADGPEKAAPAQPPAPETTEEDT